MNRHTFKDVAKSKRSSLANDLDEDEEEVVVGALRKEVEGEEDDGVDKFNDAGEVLEAFNLKDEREGGYFDENMNYVFKEDHAEVDAWVAGMDEAAVEAAIGEAARAVKRKEGEEKAYEERQMRKQKKSSKELKGELLACLGEGESAVGAMRRLGGKGVQGRAEGVVRRRAPKTADTAAGIAAAAGTGAAAATAAAAKAQQSLVRAQIERITEAADQLLSRGLSGIYDMTRQALQSSLMLWEYQGMDQITYGPFTAQQLSAWKMQGYFAGDRAVRVRSVGEAEAEGGLSATESKSGGGDIYDDDMLDSGGGGGAVGVGCVYGRWLSSDDVEFGEYVTLDDGQGQGGTGGGAGAGGGGLGSGMSGGVGGDGGGSGKVRFAGVKRGLGEEEEEEEEDGGSFRGKKRRAVQQEEDSDNDD